MRAARWIPWLVVVKALVGIAALSFLIDRLAGEQGTPDLIAPFMDGGKVYVLVPLLLLSVVNWGIESMKWRLLVAPVEQVGSLSAMRATLVGTTVGMLTPNRTGEFLGRIAVLRPRSRMRAAWLTTVGGFAQLSVTLATGALGVLAMLAFFRESFIDMRMGVLVGVGLAVLITLGCSLYHGRRAIMAGLSRIALFRSSLQAGDELRELDPRVLRRVLLLSVLRYAVFALQFVLLLTVLVPTVEVLALCVSVPVIFLVTTLLPTAVLTELGVRGSVAVAVLAPFQADPHAVVAASFLLWLVNLALPAACGGVLLLPRKVRSGKAHG